MTFTTSPLSPSLFRKTMSFPISFPLLFLSFLLSFHPGAARNIGKVSPVRAFVLPVTKDPSTGQYLTAVGQRTPLKPVKLTLDIGGKILWAACDREEYRSSSYSPALCRSKQCSLAGSTTCGNCWDVKGPNCNNNTCTNVVYNTVVRSAQVGELATDVIALQSTDGSNPGRIIRVPSFLFSCGSLFLGEGLAKGSKGMVGFGRTNTSLPSLLSIELGISKKFAICLSSAKGVAFLGNGPFSLLPPPGIIVSEGLSYTPLLVNPVTTVYPVLDTFPDKSSPSTEYFIGVEHIKINNQIVPVSAKLLNFDVKGNGGTKISTVVPYTVLHTSIYNAITKAFVKSISKVPRVKPVAPFETCYSSSSLGSTRVGPGVPQIEFGLRNNVTWTMFGANSMVYVGNSEVVCLAFVDGGKKPRTSIVIGGHQLEDNFLEFDVERSRLGFGSTLLGRQTTCANFNFTSKA